MKEKVGVSKASHSWLFDTENRRVHVPTGPIEQITPCDDDEAKDVSDGKNTAHPSLFHNESWKPPTDFVDLKEKVNEQLEHATTMILLTCTACVIVAALALSLLATCNYLLAGLFHLLVWLLDSLPWLLNALSPAFNTLGRFLFCLGLLLVYSCMAVLKAKKII